jgi:hypothetical protein
VVVHEEEVAGAVVCFKLFFGAVFSATSVIRVVVAGAAQAAVGVGVASAVAVEVSVAGSVVVAILGAVVPEEAGEVELIVQSPFLIVSRES